MRRKVFAAGVVVVVLGGAFALYWFTPWKAFTTTTVADTLPAVATAAPTSPASATPPSASTEPANRLVAQGAFVSHAHETTGRVQLIRLADGRYQLVIATLRTSDGPDVRVWLTDQPVPTKEPYNIYGKGKYVELGPLKGNAGDLVYDIPTGTDLSAFTSVDLWCKRFSVSFGAAELRAA